MSEKLRLDRKQLASLFNNNHQAIVAFEKVLGDTSIVLPTTIEEAAAQATQAISVANQALSMVQALFEALEAAESAPAVFTQDAPDDTAPRVELGDLAAQNADTARVALADQLANPTTFPAAATDAATTQTLVNALRAAAINKGL